MNDVVETNENTVEQSVEENVEGIELTDTTSNQEETESVKTYTEEEMNARVDELLSKKLARAERKIRREMENEYSDYREIGNIVSKGLETTDIKDAKAKVKNFYKEQGITFDDEPRYSDKEAKILAKSDAEELIDLGLDVAEEEANRLVDVGYENLSTRDKTKLNILADTLTREKNKQELKKMGVGEDILNNSEFNEFSKNFNSNVPFKKIYEIYKQTQPKKEVNIIGSMKGNSSRPESDYFTEAELNKLTLDDLSNPAIMAKARKSMTRE